MHFRDYKGLLRSLGKECTPERFKQAVDAATEMDEPYPYRLAYKTYIAGTQWKTFRKFAIEAADDRCQRCGTPAWDDPDPLEAHHKHYDTIGQESYDDVLVVCLPCHCALDPHRKYLLPTSIREAVTGPEPLDSFEDLFR